MHRKDTNKNKSRLIKITFFCGKLKFYKNDHACVVEMKQIN